MSGSRSIQPQSRCCGRRLTVMRSWCSATRTSTTSGRWISPANSASWKSRDRRVHPLAPEGLIRMGASIRQLHPLFVGEISGVDVRQPLDTTAIAMLWQAIDRYAVLVFRNQDLDDERQMDFARQFGELEIPRSASSSARA